MVTDDVTMGATSKPANHHPEGKQGRQPEEEVATGNIMDGASTHHHPEPRKEVNLEEEDKHASHAAPTEEEKRTPHAKKKAWEDPLIELPFPLSEAQRQERLDPMCADSRGMPTNPKAGQSGRTGA